MNTRIKNFLDRQGLSASEFADTIGVQRSNVTHVLKGRNKPSFQFIEKMIQKYPSLNAKWLITGVGEMMETKGQRNQAVLFNDDEKQPEKPAKTEDIPSLKEVIQENKAPGIINDTPVEALSTLNPDKKIERIIIFYSDQSFKAYHPSN